MHSFETGDLAVQATNDDAQETKLSAVERKYYDDPYLRHFVRSGASKAPLINRGTFTRVSAVHDTVERFLKDRENDEPRQIVSIGAGYDTLYPQMYRKKLIRDNDRFLEVDFRSLVAEKIQLIESRQALKEAFDPLGKAAEIPDAQVGFQAGPYVLTCTDLRNITELYDAVFRRAELSPDVPTLVVAEVVLIYLEPEESESILQFFTTTFKTLLFFNFEQINPNDPFGQQMVRNIEARGCPLRGIRAHPTLEIQIERFRANRFSSIVAVTMLDYYNKYLPEEQKQHANQLEALDEMEEFELLLGHYCVMWAASDKNNGQDAARLVRHWVREEPTES
mmetsp:Transcript_5089/g.15229  ORF Transcript_5089/g.15229 Transcript_5089/m.15229 type:complete len:336 (-) Transcript_5089:289-1296(-)